MILTFSLTLTVCCELLPLCQGCSKQESRPRTCLYLKFLISCWHTQRGKVVKAFATKFKGRTSRATENVFFLFSSFVLHVYFNVPRVLSLPTSRNTDILSRFPTLNYRTIAAIWRQIYCFRHLLTRRIAPAEFLSCFLPCSFPRNHAAVLGIPLIKYPTSLSLHGWGRHLCATSSPPPPSERPASYTAGHVDHEKRNTWVS